MKKLKKYAKYVIWIALFYIFSSFLIFVGLNSGYKSIEVKEVPSQISLEKAEATKSQVRVYGTVKNDSSLNGKNIEIKVYDVLNNMIATEKLKIENLKADEEKKFISRFSAENAKYCEINIKD